MELTKTAKVRIYPSKQDQSLLHETMKTYAAACNFISHYVYTTKDLSQVSVQKQTYDIVRSDYNLPSQMACNAVRTVIGSYKTNQSNKMAWIECRYKTPQMTLSWNRDYSLNSDRFSIGTLHGRIKTEYAKTGMESYFNKDIYHFGTAKIMYKHDKFFLHISVTCEVPDCDTDQICNVVGIDRGINFIAATYDSHHQSGFYSGKQIKQKRANYVKVRRQLQMRHTASARRRLKAIGQRENRWMQDVNHCISKALVDSNPKHTLFALEDLTGIKSACAKVCIKNRYVMVSWPYYDLEQKLSYKAKQKESLTKKFNPAYTSQTCPVCGHVSRDNRNRKLHLFVCKNCGYRSNDDRVSAMNLCRMGIDWVISSQVPGIVAAE